MSYRLSYIFNIDTLVFFASATSARLFFRVLVYFPYWTTKSRTYCLQRTTASEKSPFPTLPIE